MPPAVPQQQSAPLLLALPEQLLLAVLRRCDKNSQIAAAEAHSILHQAVRQLVPTKWIRVGDTLSVQQIRQQHNLDSIPLYLRNHGQHISCLSLSGKGWRGRPTERLPRLPSRPQLNSLQLHRLELQLAPGPQTDSGSAREGLRPRRSSAVPRCVLSSEGVAALLQLRLSKCRLLDGDSGLPAVLARLPGLEHLALDKVWSGGSDSDYLTLQLTSLQGLQQLTFLQLAWIEVRRSDGVGRREAPLQPLRALTGLADLRLAVTAAVPAGCLSGATGLTRLEVSRTTRLESGALLGQSQLQHLDIDVWKVPGVLMWQLELLQLLKHLSLQLRSRNDHDVPSAAAFSALTASSGLRHLRISLTQSRLPDDIWQHLLPDGVRLPHLTWLSISSARDWYHRDVVTPPPEASHIASCCPGLRSLYIDGGA